MTDFQGRPGDALEHVIRSTFPKVLINKNGCDCKTLRATMNSKGWNWCNDHQPLITGQLIQNSKKSSRVFRLLPAPFTKEGARVLLTKALKLSKPKEGDDV